MRVLVTGGAGFIGSHLVRACLEAGEDVRVFDDFSTGKRDNLRDVARDVEVVEASVVDPAARRTRGAGLRGRLSPGRGRLGAAVGRGSRRHARRERHRHAPRARGRAARGRTARRVRELVARCTATTSVCRNRRTCPSRPRSPYALQKWIGESYAEQYARLYGLGCVCLRYFNVFGPRQDPSSMYAGVIPLFVTALLFGRVCRASSATACSRAISCT